MRPSRSVILVLALALVVAVVAVLVQAGSNDGPTSGTGPQARVGTAYDGGTGVTDLGPTQQARIELASGSSYRFDVGLVGELGSFFAETYELPRTVADGVWGVVELDPRSGRSPATPVAVELSGGAREDRPRMSVVSGEVRVGLPQQWEGRQLVALPDTGEATLEIEDEGLVQRIDLRTGAATPYPDGGFVLGSSELDCPSHDTFGPAGPGERTSRPDFAFVSSCDAFLLGRTPYAAGLGWHPDGGRWIVLEVRFDRELGDLPRRTASASFTIGGGEVDGDGGQVVASRDGDRFQLWVDEDEIAPSAVLEVERRVTFAGGGRGVELTRDLEIALS